jgi:hypothetical protein
LPKIVKTEFNNNGLIFPFGGVELFCFYVDRKKVVDLSRAACTSLKAAKMA